MNKYIAFRDEATVLDKKRVDEGFTLIFDNGVLASVKFGFGSYSDEGKTTAEVAIIDDKDNWYIFNGKELERVPDQYPDVNPRVTTNDLVEILYLAKQL
jgi:hypothetical protein